MTTTTTTTRDRRLTARAEAGERTEAEGRFTALTSATGVEYDVPGALGQREVIEPGAFTFDNPIAVYVQHNHAHAGKPPIGVGNARETERGLVVDGRLFLDESEEARTVFAALESGALQEWSVGMSILESHPDPDDRKLTHVTKTDIREVSATLIGANPKTETLAVRSGTTENLADRLERDRAAQKVGRILQRMTWPPSMRERVYYALTNSREFRKLFLKARGD